jgi:hypothetical protein
MSGEGLPITLVCGCIATWNNIFDGYTVEEHTCDGAVLQAQREARIDDRVAAAEQAEKRTIAPLNGNRPFNFLRK